jgi:hypothetical protein
MRDVILAALFSLTVFVPFAKPQDSSKQNELAKGIQHLMDVQVGFERMVPPGMSIEAKEISRTGKSGKDLVVQYHIFVTGAPLDTLFREFEWPVNADKPSSPLWGISVGKNGVLMCGGRTPEQCGDSQKPDDPIEFITRPAKGEPTRLAFVAPNIKIGTVIVPDPIQSSDKGCTLNAVRLTSEFEFAFLSGSGYAPNADVHYRISSETTAEQIIKSDSAGTIRVTVMPYPTKMSKGVITVKIVEPKCSPELSYEWGTI